MGVPSGFLGRFSSMRSRSVLPPGGPGRTGFLSGSSWIVISSPKGFEEADFLDLAIVERLLREDRKVVF